MRLRRIGSVVVAWLLTMVNGFTVAHAAGDSVTVGTQAEAWYVTPAQDACAGADCSTVPSSAYPRNTLHVGISGGTPTTATYLELDVLALPYGATLTRGTLRMPVDMVPGDGSVRAETAKLRVCQVTGAVSDAKASPDKPPDTDCATSAPASYSAKPTPTFTADLAPFLSAWSQGTPATVAIQPAPKAIKAAETWHVTFFGKNYRAGQDEPAPPGQPPAPPDQDEPAPPAAAPAAAALSEPTSAPTPPTAGAPTDQQQKPQPITAKLAFQEEAITAPPAPPFEPELGPPPAAPPPAVSPIAAEPPAVASPVSAPTAKARAVEKPPRGPAPTAAPRFIKVGYAYPIAWLFPLLLLIGLGMAGHSLTRNIQHPDGALA